MSLSRYNNAGDHFMSTTIDIRELPTRLDEAVTLASNGDEVILVEGSTPRARLVPLRVATPRRAGLHLGAMQATADFDDPLSEELRVGAS